MKRIRCAASIIALVLGLFIAGCCGGGTTVKSTVVPVTTAAPVGQQLIELQKAYESGAITESEYKKLKQEAIDNSSK